MKGDEHLFLDVNLHRIANHVSPEDVEHLMQKKCGVFVIIRTKKNSLR